MSLVVGAYGTDYVVIGGDHGSWKIAQDGSPYEPSVHAESKIHEIAGCPMVIACVGPSGVSEMIDDFIARKAYIAETYRISEAAQELWADILKVQDPHAHQRFSEAGLDVEILSNPDLLDPATGDFRTEQQRRLAGLTLIVAGIDYAGLPRVWQGSYPNRDIRVLNFSFAHMSFCSGVWAMGSHDVLSGFRDFDVDWSRLSLEDAVELCDLLMDTVDRTEALREKTGKVRTVLGPYDLAVITKTGVAWRRRYEVAAAQAPEAVSAK